MTFEEEMDREYTAILHQKPKPGVIDCSCCERPWRSPDTRRIHACPDCRPHIPNRGAMGCPLTHILSGGVYRIRLKRDPSSQSNNHLFNFNGYPKFRDKRRKHADVILELEEEEPEEIDEDLVEIGKIARGRDD